MLRPVDGVPAPASIAYDTLIVAGGSHYSYFGHDEWRADAAEVKSLESALEVRSRILSRVRSRRDRAGRRAPAAWLTFVVVGAGPTGVEMAGQIAELARDTLRRDFRTIDPRTARILLVEAADRVLTTFPPSLSAKAVALAAQAGRDRARRTDGRRRRRRRRRRSTTRDARVRVPTRPCLGRGRDGLEARAQARRAHRRRGRPRGPPDGRAGTSPCPDTLRSSRSGTWSGCATPRAAVVLPGVAPVAMQQGRYVAKAVRARLSAREPAPFKYRDKGNLATIGRGAAVADIKGLKLGGHLAWLTWLFVHLWYLVGFQNRVLVFIRWTASFATHGRGARLITATPSDDQSSVNGKD